MILLSILLKAWFVQKMPSSFIVIGFKTFKSRDLITVWLQLNQSINVLLTLVALAGQGGQ